MQWRVQWRWEDGAMEGYVEEREMQIEFADMWAGDEDGVVEH